jgi:hypothetical protein
MGLATGLMALGSVVSGITGANAAKKAGRAQTAGYDAAAEESRKQYEQTRQDYSPYMKSGTDALGRLDRTATGDMTDFYTSPDYNFRRTEGTRGIGNQFAARGSGGNAMRALAEFNSGLAAGEFGNWWDRTSGMADRGMNATTNVANAGSQNAANVGNAMIGRGNARANMHNEVGSSINKAVQGGISNYLYYDQRKGGGNNVNAGTQWNAPDKNGLQTINMRTLPARRY